MHKCWIWFACISRHIFVIAVQCYLTLFPNRKQSNHKTFRSLYGRLGETGSFHPKNKNAGRLREIDADRKDEIVVCIAVDAETSTRRVSTTSGVHTSSVSRLIRGKSCIHSNFSAWLTTKASVLSVFQRA